MTTALTLATQKPFGSLTCDFYKNDNEFYNIPLAQKLLHRFIPEMRTDSIRCQGSSK